MLKLLLAITLAMVAQVGFAQTHNWVEDNDLWKEDNVRSQRNEITQDVFNNIIQKAQELYDPIAQQHEETLTINADWDDSTVNANSSRFGDEATVNMYGGLARREEVTPEGFALVVCHELGHLYGGKPYIHETAKMAAEGQADYYGARDCLKTVLAKVPPLSPPTVTDYIAKACNSNKMCERRLVGSYSLGKLLAVIKSEPIPEFETPDPLVVTETQLSYPKTVQCRLDTYHNGTFNMARPKCWFKD
jgi:hypothetical protein